MSSEQLTNTAEPLQRQPFFASHHWPVLTIIAYVCFSATAFTPRFLDYAATGSWGQSVTRAFDFAPVALNIHALLGISLIPLLVLQPLLGALLMGKGRSVATALSHRWLGRFLALAAATLSCIGFYITYTFSKNTDSITSVIFMFLVAALVISFLLEAIWQARKGRIDQHLDALVFAMIFVSVPATGRLIESAMRAGGVDNTRSRELVSVGLGYQVELVDITILLISSIPLVFWLVYSIPRRLFQAASVKLWISAGFLGLPLVAVAAQTLGRI